MNTTNSSSNMTSVHNQDGHRGHSSTVPSFTMLPSTSQSSSSSTSLSSLLTTTNTTMASTVNNTARTGHGNGLDMSTATNGNTSTFSTQTHIHPGNGNSSTSQNMRPINIHPQEMYNMLSTSLSHLPDQASSNMPKLLLGLLQDFMLYIEVSNLTYIHIYVFTCNRCTPRGATTCFPSEEMHWSSNGWRLSIIEL